MMHLKNIFLLTLCSFISGFGAFEDPFEAHQASQKFIGSHPTLPSENVVTLFCYKKDKIGLVIGSGIALNDHFVLTSCHHNFILDADTAVWVTRSSALIPLNTENENLEISKIEKDPAFHLCAKRFSFSKVTSSAHEKPIMGGHASSGALLQDIAALMSQSDFSIRNGEHIIETANDLMLLKLKTPLVGLQPLILSPRAEETGSTTVYGVAPISLWHFFDGKKCMDGLTFTDDTPLPDCFKKLDPRFSLGLKWKKSQPVVQISPQAWVHTVMPVPNKPKAFAYFEMLNDSDESFKKEESLAHHSIPVEEQVFFGPFVGGMSGAPIFKKNEKSFSLYGLVSCTQTPSLQKGGEITRIAANVYQTFTPELVQKINGVMARPEPANATAAEAKP